MAEAPYKCPKCGRLPHWAAVVLGVRAVPADPHIELDLDKKVIQRAAILSISAEICREDPAQQ